MEALNINPDFSDLNPESIIDHIESIKKKAEIAQHEEILSRLLEQVEPVDFQALAFVQVVELRKQLESISPESEQAKEIHRQLDKFNVKLKHYLVLSIENILRFAEMNRWSLCKNNDFIYLYNGAYWSLIDSETFQKFLGEAAEKMGVPEFSAKFYLFREQLLKQFLATCYLPTPQPPQGVVFINLFNGTLEVGTKGARLRPHNPIDFLTYQLPFNYDPKAKSSVFQTYLDKVLPDTERQKVLAEFLGYVFIKNGSMNLKEEKALILHGTGANGKSVFFEVVNALLGQVNVSSYSLQNLTESSGYYRAMIANKLVNYASEINGTLETAIFKQLVSGEPVDARLPYGKPMEIRQYAKLIFNCNELPKEVEHTNAYFRRFLIVPFDVTISEHEQDKKLHTKIIQNELSGVLNWVLEGLGRLLEQQGFSHCDASVRAVEHYKTQSDSVKLFIEENDYKPHPTSYKLLKDLYLAYRTFCNEDGFKPVNKSNFIRRLQGNGVQVERKNVGNVAFMCFSTVSQPKAFEKGTDADEDIPF
jgi:putative DNA primase/helicase